MGGWAGAVGRWEVAWVGVRHSRQAVALLTAAKQPLTVGQVPLQGWIRTAKLLLVRVGSHESRWCLGRRHGSGP